ncbi:MAG: Stk1 family PASTA domain-containing Ser/Thr kinase [Actinomycetota bacterium]
MKVMRDLVGESLSGRYQLVARLAGGGMGDVYRGHDLLLDRAVAIKVLQPNLAGDPEHLERFKAEARAAARFSHPNVVAVYDWGSEDDDTYYMVMEYVSGSDLRDLLVRRGAIDHGVVLEIMAEVCDALEAAHSEGLIHRDVKPENILIARDGKVKVADFGIAVVADAGRAQTGSLLGTLRYLSPEQARGNESTQLSDIWSAGAVLSELLTGHPPANGSGPEALQLRASQEPDPPSDMDESITPAIDDIVLRACALDPHDRFSSAAEMGSAVRAANVESWGRKAPVVTELQGDLTGEVHLVDMEPTSYDPNSKSARAKRARRVRARRRFAVLGLLAAILVAFGGVRALTGPERVDVPPLAGMSKSQAEAAATELGLELEVGGRSMSYTVDRGGVLRQSPADGTLIEGSVVTVVLSTGPPMVVVPDVIGMNDSQLLARLESSGLELGRTTKEFSLEPRGTVIRQTPDDGKLRWGSTLDVTISKGPQSLEVPDVSGMKYREAAKALRKAGFVPVRVDSYSDEVASGKVVSTEPAASVTALEGGDVEVFVSIGPEFEELTMPDVRNLSLEQAQSKLESRGLRVDVVQSCGANGTLVVETEPVAGVTVRENTVVALFVC